MMNSTQTRIGIVTAAVLLALTFAPSSAGAQEVDDCDGGGTGTEEWNGDEVDAYFVSWDCDGSGESWSEYGIWYGDQHGYCYADGYTSATMFEGSGGFDATYASSASGSCDEDGGSGSISDGSYAEGEINLGALCELFPDSSKFCDNNDE